MDLLDLINEQLNGPLPCEHVYKVGPRLDGYGWTHETDPTSAYYGEWVHSRPDCRRSSRPGHSVQQPPGGPPIESVRDDLA